MKETVPAEVLDDLVQIVTHRIASLTAGVEGYADMLADSLRGQEERRLLRHILEGVARINGVVDDLRFYVQEVQPVLIPVDPSSLVESAVAFFGDEPAPSFMVGASVAADCRMMADPHLTRQILHALIQNGVDAAGPGGRVEVRMDNTDAEISIRIWNDGAMLSRHDGERAMAPFYTTKARNLGLGLTLARRMAQQQGGDVTIESSDGGTSVVLRMPVAVAQ